MTFIYVFLNVPKLKTPHQKYLFFLHVTGPFYPISPLRWLIAVCLPLYMSMDAIHKKKLDPLGAILGRCLSESFRVISLHLHGFQTQSVLFWMKDSYNIGLQTSVISPRFLNFYGNFCVKSRA